MSQYHTFFFYKKNLPNIRLIVRPSDIIPRIRTESLHIQGSRTVRYRGLLVSVDKPSFSGYIQTKRNFHPRTSTYSTSTSPILRRTDIETTRDSWGVSTELSRLPRLSALDTSCIHQPRLIIRESMVIDAVATKSLIWKF